MERQHGERQRAKRISRTRRLAVPAYGRVQCALRPQDQRKWPVVVTIATFEDVAELETLINSVYRGVSGLKSWTTEAHLVSGQRVHLEYLRQILTGRESFLLIRRGPSHELEGCVHVKKHPNFCYVGLLSVQVSTQQQGVGRALLNEAEMFARENLSCSTMRMTVIHQRQELLDYYHRRGYQITGEHEPFSGDHIIGHALREDLFFEVLEKKL
jgi:ribosomal protein S18 acetylase RimI-like enzyme